MRKIDLSEKVAIVAGGAGDIGMALSKGLADAGAAVAVLDRKLDSITDDRLKGFLVDLSSVDEIKGSVQKVTDELGGVDILVHVAAINFHKTFFDISEETWDKTIDVNLKSAFFLTQAVAESMKERGGGKVVFISSISAKVGYPGLTDYTASKGGMEAMMRNLATELAPMNICVNAIEPGTTRTQMTKGLWEDRDKCAAHEATIPMERMAVPEDHVGPVLFFASDLSDYVTGTVLPCDGGLTAYQADFIDLKLRKGE